MKSYATLRANARPSCSRTHRRRLEALASATRTALACRAAPAGLAAARHRPRRCGNSYGYMRITPLTSLGPPDSVRNSRRVAESSIPFSFEC
jgi:hypothetical protein